MGFVFNIISYTAKASYTLLTMMIKCHSCILSCRMKVKCQQAATKSPDDTVGHSFEDTDFTVFPTHKSFRSIMIMCEHKYIHIYALILCIEIDKRNMHHNLYIVIFK